MRENEIPAMNEASISDCTSSINSIRSFTSVGFSWKISKAMHSKIEPDSKEFHRILNASEYLVEI